MTTEAPVLARELADDLERQVAHWLAAARLMLDAEQFAAASAWAAVETQVGLPLRRTLSATVKGLLATGDRTAALVRAARTDPAAVSAAAEAVQRFRRLYSQVETTLEYFGDAVNSRTSPDLRVALQTLDALAAASMSPVLSAAGMPVPPILTYVDKGMGASILRAGVRLWAPGTVNPVAAVKVVRHNLYRPTSLFHESGHQVASLTGWVPSLARRLSTTLEHDPSVRAMWIPWASEIVADVHAFAHTGFAAVSALYDVVGDARTILSWPVGDPHPVGWLRTLLGTAMCRQAFGSGPWDAMEEAMVAAHPLSRADPSVAQLLSRSRNEMPRIADACLAAPIPKMGGRPVSAAIDPSRVSPAALGTLERTGGAGLWTSTHYRSREGIRLVALAGLREAERPDRAAEWIDRARKWMTSAAA